MSEKLMLLVLSAVLTSCGWSRTSDAAACATAEQWAEAYFNFDFHRAQSLSTPESEKWLRFAASNTTESDLRLVQDAGGASVTASEVVTAVDDTLRVVKVEVSQSIAPTPVGRQPRLDRDASFEVKVVRRADRWQVRMEDLPRSGKQSRD